MPDLQAAPRFPDGVTLQDHSGSVTLRNSEIALKISKNEPKINALYKRGKYENVNLLEKGSGYYLLNYTVGSDRRTYGGRGMRYRLIHESPEGAEISLSINDPRQLPFHIDYRFVLLADSPGFYIYSIFRYPEGMPADAELDQSRYAFRANPSIFTHYGIEDESAGDRFEKFPRPAQLRKWPQIFDATYLFGKRFDAATLDSDIYTKYEHSVFIGDNSVCGLFGDDIGMYLIRPSDEYLVGGPEKQEYYTNMSTTTPLLYFYEQVRHYGVPSVVPEKGWEKIYGPFYVYLNEGDDVEKMWRDAKARTATEKASWPYQWLEHPLYQATERSVVQGKLSITDGSSAEDAWVILGQPEPPVFEQNLDYLNYVQAEADGTFSIPHVRPGTYTLYAHVDGVPGEFRRDNIEVGKSETVKIAELAWTPPDYGELLWQIGKFNRTPREFRHGDRLREWGTWLRYPLDFPNGVNFRIGTSNEAEDWNYAQPAFKTPGKPENLLVEEDLSPAPWNIFFDLDKSLSGTATLTVAVAGSAYAGLNITCNGKQIADYATVPPKANDASFYRSGAGGYYRELIIPFDASLLQKGANKITLLVSRSPKNKSSRHAGIMYDCLRLEVDAEREFETQ